MATNQNIKFGLLCRVEEHKNYKIIEFIHSLPEEERDGARKLFTFILNEYPETKPHIQGKLTWKHAWKERADGTKYDIVLEEIDGHHNSRT